MDSDSGSEEYICPKSPKTPTSPKKRGAAEDSGSPTKKSKSSSSSLKNPSELSAEEWTIIDNLRNDGKTWPEIGKELGCKHANDALRRAHSKRLSDTFEWSATRRAEYKSLLLVAVRDISAKMGIPKVVFEKELKESGIL